MTKMEKLEFIHRALNTAHQGFGYAFLNWAWHGGNIEEMDKGINEANSLLHELMAEETQDQGKIKRALNVLDFEWSYMKNGGPPDSDFLIDVIEDAKSELEA